MILRTITAVAIFMNTPLMAQQATTQFQYDRNTRASDYAKSYFGNPDRFSEAKRLNMGKGKISASTRLDCGNLDVNANFDAEFKRLQEQLKQIIPSNANEWKSLGGKMAMLSVCYAYPTLCAQLRHDFLSLQANLDLRAQACKAIDSYLDNQADVGAKQLRAEAQANCIDDSLRGGNDMASATAKCQGKTGLPLRDFSSGLEKRFTDRKQKVLQSMVNFAQNKEPATYNFLASMVGEIEVQQDGYWQPLFDQGMYHPNDAATTFLASGENSVCRSLAGILKGSTTPKKDSVFETSVFETIKLRVTKDDISNLEDLANEDRDLACAALGRAIGKVAAEKSSSKAEAVLSSGLLNNAVPQNLRQEYSERSGHAFNALRKSLEGDQIPSIDSVRDAIATLARVAREKNRLLASLISENKKNNADSDQNHQSECTDTLTCSKRRL